MFKKISAVTFLLIVVLTTYIYYKFDLSQYFSLENIQHHRQIITYWFQNYKWQFITIFFIAYSLSCFFIIPLFYLLLNIVAGFIFGISMGFIIASIVNFYSTIITFLAARFLFRGFIEKHFSKTINKVNQQLNTNGILYIFFIRSFPIMPFIVSNIMVSLTRINLWVYVIISQLSIIPELLLTLYVGKKLDEITSLNQFMNAKNYTIIFILIAIFALAWWILNRKINKKNKINNKSLSE